MVAINIFKWIGDLFTNYLFIPFKTLRLGGFNWWSSNIVSWFFILILFVLLGYWIKETIRFKKEGTEDKA